MASKVLAENKRLRNGLMFAIKCIKSLNEFKTKVKKILDFSKDLKEFPLVLTEEYAKTLTDLSDNCDKVLYENPNNIGFNLTSIQEFINDLKKTKDIDTEDQNEITKEPSDKITLNWIKCPITSCNDVYKNPLEMQKHIYDKHRRSITFCPYIGCGLDFATNKETREHINEVHKGIRIVEPGVNDQTEQDPNQDNQTQPKDQTSDSSKPVNTSAKSVAKRKKSQTLRIVENEHYIISFVLMGDKMVHLFKCVINDCNTFFPNYDKFHDHVIFHYKCPANGCDHRVQCPSQIDYHLAQFHPDYQYLISRVNKCPNPWCEHSFSTQPLLLDHLTRCQQNRSDPQLQTLSSAPQESAQSFKCESSGCMRTFGTKEECDEHQTTHDNSYKCDVEGCGFISRNDHNFRRHMRTKHLRGKPHVCDHEGCEASFMNLDHYRKHQKAIHSSDFVECSVDDCKARVREKYMKTHMSIYHSKGKTARHCDYPDCEFKTYTFENMQNHKKMFHSNEKRFVCDWNDCGKRFKQRFHFELHILSHKNEKAFACEWPGCEYRGNTKYSVTHHIQMNHEIQYISCHWPGCDRRLKTKGMLKLHLNTHTNEKPMVCDFPGCNYRTGCSYFYEHRKKHYK